MKDIFDAAVESPLALLKSFAIDNQAEIVKIKKNHTKTIADLHSQVAQLAKQFWTLSQILSSMEIDPHIHQAINIYIKNFYNGLTRMGIELIEASSGLYSEETGKHFEIITSLPSPDVKALTVNRTLSPAILLNKQLLVKGGIQILEPAEETHANAKNKTNKNKQ